MHADAAIPPHLRQYVVEQDYGQYTARDQAVWRFVLTHTHARLLQTAHPAYAHGFVRAGISTERIPELARMDERLRESGFRVVCVDGFIPPRAFQGFQARGVLPIAADIRTGAHLTYTPAPDIIHEAAGHAPLLPDPDYARFLRRVGACSEHAFETPHDRAVYRAIYALSEIKEHPTSTPELVAAAEAELARLHESGGGVSEATRMARFYWWTVEYGLVGSPGDFRLYGAGLLSSIGEAHFCHDERVEKRVLDARCIEVDYDITQAQPQLFVARDFAHLEQVLEEIERSLSHARGGREALLRAEQSEELCTLTVDSGLQLAGKVLAHDEGWVELEGPCALARDGALLPEFGERLPRYLLPLGELEDGTPLSALSLEQLQRACDAAGRLRLRTRAGLSIEGLLGELSVHAGRVQLASVHDCRIARGDDVWLRSTGPYPLLLAQRVTTASPVLPAGFLPATAYPAVRVPKPRSFEPPEQTLIALHAQAAELRCGPAGAAAEARLAAMHSVLGQRFPTEWLLRFDLLEALHALGAGQGPLARAMERELEQLELHFDGREPIATGLAYLRGTHPVPARDSWAGALRQSGASRRTR
jgi:phenylalanine-4-hydroxylase